jgi:hypothetical protein
MAPFDPWDQAQLTHLIRRQLTYGRENIASLADTIAPKLDVQSRRVKFKIVAPDAFGVGQLRAPDADPKLTRSSFSREERVIDLALPDEMERVSEDIQQKLASTDENIKDSGGLDLITRGAILAERNRRAVERMRWQAFLTGKVTTNYDETQSDATIDFGLMPSHVVDAATPWTDIAASDPVQEVRAWQKQMADDIGFYGLKIHMNSTTWEKVLENEKLMGMVSTNSSREYRIATKADFQALLYEGSEVVIYDGGYREPGSDKNPDGSSRGLQSYGFNSMTPWIPDGKVLITTPYQIDGEKIADTPDGLVAVATGYNSIDWRQGAQAEQIIHPISKNIFLRYGRAAIPRLRVPEAFFVADVF